MEPIILFEGKYTYKDLIFFKKKHKIRGIIDIYLPQQEEFFEIRNPKLKFSKNFRIKRQDYINKLRKRKRELLGNWVYFPWNGYLVHMVNEKEYNELRTNRNRNLITKAQQKKLYNFTVGVVGLSVGSSIAIGFAYHGVAKRMKLAERDVLETTNLNRIVANLADIGQKKIDIALRAIYDINPYAEIFPYDKGLDEKSLIGFLRSKPKPKVIFDEIDDFKMKVLIRVKARHARIPVIMMTNLGDSILVDVERYDKERNLELFNGRVGKLPERILKKGEITNEDEQRFAIGLVGKKNLTPEIIESVKKIGKTLVGRPQFSSTVAVSGGIASYLVRQLALNRDLPSGRRLIKFEETFIPTPQIS